MIGGNPDFSLLPVSLNFGYIVSRTYISRASQLEPDAIQNQTDFMKMIS